MNPAMRRIPRPVRSLDPSAARPRIPSPYTAASVSAPFSTSAPNAFLNLKQDKKKHMAMVRKWQRRIIGDSEPIGSRVDPYDPTSPVRIAPEETGEEQEVIEGTVVMDEALGEEVEYVPYEPAESGEGLYRIGDKRWKGKMAEEEARKRFVEITAREVGVVRYSFGPEAPIASRKAISRLFNRALVEVYTLKEAGKNLDLASYPSAGKYNVPFKFEHVRFTATSPTDIALQFPTPAAKAQLLAQIEKAPAAPGTPQPEFETEELLDDAEPVKKEPDAPGSRRAALVKNDGPTFDFMSNRPVPRAAPPPAPAPAAKKELDVHAASEASHKAVSEMRSTVLEAVAQHHEAKIAAMRAAVRGKIEADASESVTVVEPVETALQTRLREIKITDPEIKFALTKRLTQLTGIRIPDFELQSISNLGTLLNTLTAHRKITTKSPKLHEKIATPAKLGKLPNVRVFKKAITEVQKEKEIGRWKVIQYALEERGLPVVPKKGAAREALQRRWVEKVTM